VVGLDDGLALLLKECQITEINFSFFEPLRGLDGKSLGLLQPISI